MKDFSMTVDVNHGEQGFALSTLEAVFLYLENVQPSWIDVSQRNNKLWETLKTGTLEEFKAVYKEEEEIEKKKDEEKEKEKKEEGKDKEDQQQGSELPSANLVHIENIIESKDKEGNDLVLLAASTGRVDIMQFLIEEQDHSLYTKNYEGNNPMHLAILNDRKDLIKYLSSLPLTTHDYKKKNMDYQESFLRSNSCMLLANLAEDDGTAEPQKIIKILMNKQNHERVTPQMLLIKNSKQKLLDCFQNEYLDLLSINEPSFSYDTPLILACKEGHYDLIKFLIENGADCSFQNPLGNTAFHYADETSIKMLLDHCKEWDHLDHISRCPNKPNPNLKNKESLTPFMYHCREGHIDVVQIMLNYPSIDITTTDMDGRT